MIPTSLVLGVDLLTVISYTTAPEEHITMMTDPLVIQAMIPLALLRSSLCCFP